MKLKSRCIPFGSLPYTDIESTTRMVAKLFERFPYDVMLPNIAPDDSLAYRTLAGIPGIKFKEGKILIKTTSNIYKQKSIDLDKAFNNPSLENLDSFAIESPFIEKFFDIIKKFKSPNAAINLLGPFTISQILNNVAEEQMLADKSYRKLFIQAVCVKALWAVEAIKLVSPETTPVVILEEPSLAKLGDLRRENEDITTELVTTLLTRVIEKIKATGAIVAVQCFEKCDWTIPINAGADILSFDAYNNPNNLCIIPEQIVEFLDRGGKINWGIIPTKSDAMLKVLTIDEIASRLFSTMQGLVLAGVPAAKVFNSALVSTQGNTDKLQIIFAEKALILATQLAKRIPVKSES